MFALRGRALFLILSLTMLAGCGKNSVFPNLLPSASPGYRAQKDCGFVQNVYGERISWKNKTPVRLQIHESFPSSFYPALENAVKDWEKALGRPVFQIVEFGTKGPLQPRQDGSNVIYWMSTWEDGRTSEQARTSVYWVGNEIREADVRINAKDFTFYLTTPQSVRDVHLESLIIHELGHVLGLKHNDAGTSVMATYLSSLTTRTEISASDLTSLGCEY